MPYHYNNGTDISFLRLTPVSAFGVSRTFEKDIEVGGYHIPAGVRKLGLSFNKKKYMFLFFSILLKFDNKLWQPVSIIFRALCSYSQT